MTVLLQSAVIAIRKRHIEASFSFLNWFASAMSQKPSEGNTSNGRYRTRKTRSKKKENKRLRVSSEDFSRDETPLAKRKAIRWTQDEWTDDSIPVATEDEQDIEDPAKVCLFTIIVFSI